MIARKEIAFAAKVFAVVFVAGGALLLASSLTPSRAEPERLELVSAEQTSAQRPVIRVIDGDTVEDMTTATRYRLVNIDTAETGSRAQCVAERQHGDDAKARVRELVAAARAIDLRPTGRIDRYGRTIAFVVLDGRDLGETLMQQGLARPWRGHREPWCNPDGSLIP